MALIDREQLICIGIVKSAHGVRGEMKLFPLTDAPEYYRAVEEVVLATKNGLTVHPVQKLQMVGRFWQLALKDISDRTAAELLKGAEVLLDKDALKPLEGDEYFQHELIGCTVETVDGKNVGQVTHIMETGANDVLEVATQNGTAMIPLVKDVIRTVDTTARMIRIEPLPGLLDPDEAE